MTLVLLEYEQHLDNLRWKDPLRGAETNEISVRLGNYSASHFEGPAYTPEEFERMGETGLRWIVRQEGVTLYERPPS